MGLDAALAVFLLLVVLPPGLLLTRGLLPAKSRIARGGTATLAALGVLAALAHAGMALGVRGRIIVPALAAAGLAAGIWGIVRSRRLRGTPTPQGALRALGGAVLLEALPLLIVVSLLAFSYVDAGRFAIFENDAIRIWAPKAARALDEAPPRIDGTDQAHPEYPRGIGLLTAGVATCVGHVDPRLPRLVPLFLFAMTLLAIFDALSARGNVAGACAAVLILGAMPAVLHQASSGLVDLPLAGFLMLGGIGLAPQRDGRPATAIALAGAWGALVTKDEGLVACGALLLVLLVRLVKTRQLVRALAALVLTAMVATPWVLLRSHVQGEAFLLRSAGPNAGLLLMRFDTMIVELGHLALGLPDPSPGGYSLPDVVPGKDLVVLTTIACGLILLVGRGGSFPVLPAGLLLITDFWVIVFSTVGIDWQLVTAYNRLVLQVLPLLLLAAIDKLTTARAALPEPAETPAAAAA